MLRKIAHVSTLPETDEGNQGEAVTVDTSTLIARFVSIREKIDEAKGEASTGDLDSLAAPWFDAAVSKHPKAEALAAEMGVTPPYLSAMRHGDKPVPLRALVALLAYRECAYEFACQFLMSAMLPLPPRETAKIERADVCETALALLVDGPLFKSLIRECSEKYGATADDVLRALSNK